MTQTSNRFYDRVARLMNDAANVAQGVRREASTVVRGQAERIIADMDLVRRDEFEAVKEMARLAREENEKLEARLAKLEGKTASGGTRSKTAASSGTKRRTTAKRKTAPKATAAKSPPPEMDKPGGSGEGA